MFITTDQITELKEKETDSKIKAMIGEYISYLFLVEPGHLCGMHSLLVGMREDSSLNDDDLFFADIAVKTPVEDIYTYLKDLRVTGLLMEGKDGSSYWILARADKIEEIKSFYEINQTAKILQFPIRKKEVDPE